MNCPVCNGETFFTWGKAGAYSILRCECCGLGVTSPFPSQEILAKANSEIYQAGQRIRIYLSKQGYFEKRYRKYIKSIKRYKEHGALLDIGCSIGLFLKIARQNGFATTGVELNTDCADFGRKHFNIDIYSKRIEDLSFPEETFDVITIFDVLEHIPDMDRFLLELGRILKKDGLLMLQSPNIDSFMARLTKTKWNWLTPPDHLYHFTPGSITRLLESRGYCIKGIKTWEPAEEFSNNLFIAYCGLLGGIISEINRRVKIFSLPVILLQRAWWRRMKGGLITVCAVKRG